MTAHPLFDDRCGECGKALDPAAPYAEQRKFCNATCYNAHYHRMEREALLESKRDRPPCRRCGGPVAPEKNVRAVYCSVQCQRRAGRDRWRLQFARLCDHCKKPFVPHNGEQRFCCPWCQAQALFRKHQPRPCQWCGILIEQPRRAAAKYCNSTCAAYAREAARRAP